MQNNTVVHGEHCNCGGCHRFFAWSPIIVGALVAIGLGFLLDLFAMGIGLSLYTTDADGAMALAIGGLVGLLIGAIATMFTAGFAAGFFSGPFCKRKRLGFLYGFLAWCLGLILMSILASSMAHYNQMKQRVYFTTATSATPAYTTERHVAATTQSVTDRLHPATDATDSQAEKNVRAAGMISFSMFLIFFVGALSATFGGICGLSSWEKRCSHDVNNNTTTVR